MRQWNADTLLSHFCCVVDLVFWVFFLHLLNREIHLNFCCNLARCQYIPRQAMNTTKSIHLRSEYIDNIFHLTLKTQHLNNICLLFNSFNSKRVPYLLLWSFIMMIVTAKRVPLLVIGLFQVSWFRASRIQRIPATLICSLVHHVGSLPTLRLPVRGRHSRTFGRLSCHWSLDKKNACFDFW